MNIRSSKLYIKNDELCRAIALLRAGERCEFCGEPAWQRHHIFYLPSERMWQSRLNHNFHLILCLREHLAESYAPHVNNEKFLRLLEAKLIFTDKPRLTVIFQHRQLIKSGKIPNIRPDLKFIRKDLEKELAWREQTAWQDVEARQVP